ESSTSAVSTDQGSLRPHRTILFVHLLALRSPARGLANVPHTSAVEPLSESPPRGNPVSGRGGPVPDVRDRERARRRWFRALAGLVGRGLRRSERLRAGAREPDRGRPARFWLRP